MIASIALVGGGAAIVLVGVYFWMRPEHYYRSLHRSSTLAELNVRPPIWAVKLGAGLSVIIGLVVVGWGVGQLLS